MQINILIITNNWIIGGVERVIKNLCENLDEKKYNINLLIVKKSTIEQDMKEPKIEFPKNAKVYKILSNNYFLLAIKTFFFLKSFNYQLIITASDISFAFFVNIINHLLNFLKIKQKTKVIITFHNFFDFKKRKLIHFFSKSFLVKYFYKIFLANLYIAVSSDLRDYVIKILRIPENKILTIYNPVLSKEILEKKYKIPEEFKKFKNIKKILCISRLNITQKDFITLIKAFDLVKEKIPELKLFIIGDGQDKEKVISIIESSEFSKDIILIGPKKLIYPYIKYSDIFVLSSNFEGLPTVIVEAMACGCPVVATDCSFGPRELIGNNEFGLLVPVKDYKKMAEAIHLLLLNENLRLRIIKKAKEKIYPFFIDYAVAQYEKIINELI